MSEKNEISGRIRLGKASDEDLNVAYRLMSLVDAIDDGYYPSNEEGAPTFFDEDDRDHLQLLYRLVNEIAENSGGIHRVVGAAGILLDPKNNLIDPDEDCIELHPDLKATIAAGEEVEAMRSRISALEAERDALGLQLQVPEKDAARYRWLRYNRGFSIANQLFGEQSMFEFSIETLDSLIDKARQTFPLHPTRVGD